MKKKLVHGGDWEGYRQEFNEMPLDFSANISPLGLPEGVKARIIDALDEDVSGRYPDPLCRTVREKLAAAHTVYNRDITSDNIFCGNGVSDILDRLAMVFAGKRALVTGPTFAEYETSLARTGCRVDHFILSPEKNFRVTEELAEYITVDTDLLFLCEPNNPTGMVTEKSVLLQILDRCRDTGTLAVVDESFMDFLEDEKEHTLLGELMDYKLLIFRSFTKSFCMAGLRMGYCFSGDTELLEKLREAGQPWSVSGIAQEAAIAALDETEYLDRLRELTVSERRKMSEGLKSLGVRVFPGMADYLLFHTEVTDLDKRLRSRGILIRSCSNYVGLGEGWFRTAVKRPEDNDIFLRKLEECLR